MLLPRWQLEVSLAIAGGKVRVDNLIINIILVFDEERNQLQQWIVVDGKDRRTTVQLANIETGGKFDPKLFIGKIDRPEGKASN